MPKVFLKQILWHSKDNKRPDRVYSIDWQPNTKRIASAGADEFIHIWEVSIRADLSIQCLSRLIGHEREVNIVRWNPSGSLLASGGTDKNVFIWRRSEKPENLPLGYDASVIGSFPEFWNRFAASRCTDTVSTLCWSPDGSQIVTALEDFKVVIFSLNEGTSQLNRVSILEGHTHMVQGVSWDPLNEFIASQSCDQSVRIWSRKADGKGWKLENVIKSIKERNEEVRGTYSDYEASKNLVYSEKARQNRSLFYPESVLPTFFRRLEWSPDGSILVVPAGVQYLKLAEEDGVVATSWSSSKHIVTRSSTASANGANETICVSYVFHRKSLYLCSLPFATQKSTAGVPVVSRFSPISFKSVATTTPPPHREAKLSAGVVSDIQETQSWIFRPNDKKESILSNTEKRKRNQTSVKLASSTACSPYQTDTVFSIASPHELRPETELPTSAWMELGITERESWFLPSAKRLSELDTCFPKFVYAVGTVSGQLLLYDTQCFSGPIAVVRNLHLAPITDLAWSDDGFSLAVSSSDGCVALITFDSSELGEPLFPSTHYGVQTPTINQKLGTNEGGVSPSMDDALLDKSSYYLHSHKGDGIMKHHHSETMLVVGNAAEDPT